MQFDSLDDIKAFCRDLPEGDARSADGTALAQQALTKPPGSLGRLEELAVWLARRQRTRSRAAARFKYMRLGEASGAGVAILLLRAALACHAGMATFAEPRVSSADK